MTYATRQTMEDRFGAPELARIAGDLTLTPPDPDRTVPALADAAAEIDAALAERYPLPLPTHTTYPALVVIQCDLARERLYDDGDIESVMQGARRSRMLLMRLARGEDRLVDGTGAIVAARTHARVDGASARLTRKQLRDA